MTVEMATLGSPFPLSLMVSVDSKAALEEDRDCEFREEGAKERRVEVEAGKRRR